MARNKNDKQGSKVLILLPIIATFFIYKKFSKAPPATITKTEVSHQDKKMRQILKSKQKDIVEELSQYVVDKKDEDSPKVEETKEVSIAEKEFQHQKALKKRFLSKTQLKVSLPKEMKYRNIHTDDDEVAIMYGKSNSNEFSMIATSKKVNLEMSLKYIKEQKSKIPLLNGINIRSNYQARTIKAPSGSGLRSVQVIDLKSSGSQKVYGAFVKRSDNKGNYMFFFRADKSFYNDKEWYFDDMLSSLQAK